MQRSDFPAAICLPCFFSLSGILVLSDKSNRDLTGCLDDIMCNANGPSTPGLRKSLAMIAIIGVAFQHEQTLGRIQQEQDFGAQYHSRLGKPSQSIHPRYLSVYASTSLLPDSLQHSIPGVWLTLTRAGFPPACHQTISSPLVQRIVRQHSVALTLRREETEQWPRLAQAIRPPVLW